MTDAAPSNDPAGPLPKAPIAPLDTRAPRPPVVRLRKGVVTGLVMVASGLVAGSLAWGMVADGFRPDRFDVLGAAICLAGVAVIMYAPRPT